MGKKSNFYRDGLAYDAQLEARGQVDMGKDFFLWAAQNYGDPILELGCGSGRITNFLAQNGFEIVGMDLSQDLIDDAKLKSKQENLTVDFIQGDMTDFHLGRKFKLIMTTCFAFMHLYTNQDLYSHFHCVREHLDLEGVYVFETFNPDIQRMMNAPNDRPYAEYDDPRTCKHVVMTQSNTYDSKTQINTIKFKIDTGGEIFHQETRMRQIFPQELNMLLDFQNFKLVAKYGNYERDLFEDKPSFQMVVCKPA